MQWLNWFDRLMLEPAGWVQLVVMLCAVVVAFGLRSGLTLWLHRVRKRSRRKLLRSVLDLINRSFSVLTPMLALLCLAMAHSGLENAQLPTDALPLGYQVIGAWLGVEIIIRLVSSLAMKILLFTLASTALTLDVFGLLRPAIAATKRMAFSMGDMKITLYGVVTSIITLIVLLWFTRGLQSTTEQLLRRVTMRGSTRQLLLKTLSVLLYCVVGLVALSLLGIDITALAVFGGALGVGIGFGLQKIASNFISGIILLLEKSVEVDDLIDLGGGINGFVRQTGARYTLVEIADGRAVMVPNEDFITQRVTNFTFLNRKARVDVRVTVAYDSDLTKVKQLMLDAAMAHPRCSKTTEPACFVTDLGDSAIHLLLHFWVDDVVEGKLGPQSDVLVAILDAFRTHHIKIPYPQREMHVIPASPGAAPSFPPAPVG